jgi:hypothetical protein
MGMRIVEEHTERHRQSVYSLTRYTVPSLSSKASILTPIPVYLSPYMT